MGPTEVGWDGQGCRGRGSEQLAEGQLPKTVLGEIAHWAQRQPHPTHSGEGGRQAPPQGDQSSPEALLPRKLQKQPGLRWEKRRHRGPMSSVSFPSQHPDQPCHRGQQLWAGRAQLPPLAHEDSAPSPHTTCPGCSWQRRGLFLPHSCQAFLLTKITSPFLAGGRGGRCPHNCPVKVSISAPRPASFNELLSPLNLEPSLYHLSPVWRRGRPWVPAFTTSHL